MILLKTWDLIGQEEIWAVEYVGLLCTIVCGIPVTMVQFLIKVCWCAGHLADFQPPVFQRDVETISN